MTDSRVRRNRTAIAGIAIAVVVVTAGLVATSGGSAAGLAAPVNQSPPTISGTAQEGMTLTASSALSVAAPFSSFAGPVQTTSVISPLYTPGIGNLI